MGNKSKRKQVRVIHTGADDFMKLKEKMDEKVRSGEWTVEDYNSAIEEMKRRMSHSGEQEGAEQSNDVQTEAAIDTADVEDSNIVDDQAHDSAQRAGYPVLKGEQIVPYRTWVRAEDRENYGLVVGMAPELRLWVDFSNKEAGFRKWKRL